ncbi:MAG: glycosyltransferase [Spirochaetales bacterium]|nr:glycosyltransferase [Spirochaetales bacterium]
MVNFIMKEKKKNYRLLYIIPAFIPGGAEKLSVYFLNKIDRTVFSPALCLFEKKGELLEQLPSDLKAFNLKKKSRFSFFRLVFSLRRTVNRFRPDIIFSRNWYANLTAAITKKLFIMKPSLLVFLEHNDLRDLAGKKLRMRLKKLLMKFIFRWADKIVVVSHGVKKELRRDFNILRKKITVINNAVDIKAINRLKDSEPAELNWFNESIPIIVSMGKLLPRKGFPNLIKAFKIIRAKKDCRLVIIGKGPEMRNLLSLVKLYNLESDVQLTGYIKNPYPLISRAGVFALPSYWEGFGNVIIEAMACGIPSVATNCPYGPEEIIQDNINGLLVPVGDVQTLAESLLKVLDDHELRIRLSQSALIRAVDFDVDRMVKAYEKLAVENA